MVPSSPTIPKTSVLVGISTVVSATIVILTTASDGVKPIGTVGWRPQPVKVGWLVTGRAVTLAGRAAGLTVGPAADTDAGASGLLASASSAGAAAAVVGTGGGGAVVVGSGGITPGGRRPPAIDV